jgi:flagellar P-ring protein precursor FlgI
MKYWLLLCSVFISISVNADRLKDISSVEGVRDNQLFGYGLVIGLNGTGDNSNFTDQSFTGMLAQFGIVLPEGVSANSQNVAAVSLTATLPPFSKPGQKIDITASSIGSASSLRGGTLLLSTLKGADGQVYAIAQGNLVVGGLGSQGNDGSKTSLNIPTVGRIPNGASVERTVPNSFNRGDTLTFNLNRPDFTTAKQVSDSINALLGPGVAKTLDATSIRVYIQELRAQVLAGLKEGKSVDDLIKSVTMDDYKGWGWYYENWRPLNIQGMARYLSEIGAVE